MIRYDSHALFQMQRRGIRREWVEMALRFPEEQEVRDNKRSLPHISTGENHAGKSGQSRGRGVPGSHRR